MRIGCSLCVEREGRLEKAGRLLRRCLGINEAKLHLDVCVRHEVDYGAMQGYWAIRGVHPGVLCRFK